MSLGAAAIRLLTNEIDNLVYKRLKSMPYMGIRALYLFYLLKEIMQCTFLFISR